MDNNVNNYSVKIYDVTNSTVIAEATLTNKIEKSMDLGALNNIPEKDAILEVQIKKSGGGINDKVYCDLVTLYS